MRQAQALAGDEGKAGSVSAKDGWGLWAKIDSDEDALEVLASPQGLGSETGLEEAASEVRREGADLSQFVIARRSSS